MLRGLDEADVREEHEGQLLDMLGSVGFREVFLPALIARRDKTLRMLATTHAELDVMRQLQGEFKILNAMIDNPKAFILGRER